MFRHVAAALGVRDVDAAADAANNNDHAARQRPRPADGPRLGEETAGQAVVS